MSVASASLIGYADGAQRWSEYSQVKRARPGLRGGGVGSSVEGTRTPAQPPHFLPDILRRGNQRQHQEHLRPFGYSSFQPSPQFTFAIPLQKLTKFTARCHKLKRCVVCLQSVVLFGESELRQGIKGAFFDAAVILLVQPDVPFVSIVITGEI